MKNLIPYKIFENSNQKNPQIGDYICAEYDDDALDDVFLNFIKSNIGQIIDIKAKLDLIYHVKYEMYDEIENMFFKEENIYYTGFNKSEIKFFSKNKEDCNLFLQSKKYNL